MDHEIYTGYCIKGRGTWDVGLQKGTGEGKGKDACEAHGPSLSLGMTSEPTAMPWVFNYIIMPDLLWTWQILARITIAC